MRHMQGRGLTTPPPQHSTRYSIIERGGSVWCGAEVGCVTLPRMSMSILSGGETYMAGGDTTVNHHQARDDLHVHAKHAHTLPQLEASGISRLLGLEVDREAAVRPADLMFSCVEHQMFRSDKGAMADGWRWTSVLCVHKQRITWGRQPVRISGWRKNMADEMWQGGHGEAVPGGCHRFSADDLRIIWGDFR